MRVVLSQRIALVPAAAQEVLLRQAVGVSRFAYNWALAEWQRQYQAGGKPSEAALRRQLNALKRQEFPWMLSVPKSVPQQAIKNFGAAFQRFFKKQGRYPKFKKKDVRDAARWDNGPGTFEFAPKRVRLPVIGWVKLREELRFSGKAFSTTVRRVADRCPSGSGAASVVRFTTGTLTRRGIFVDMHSIGRVGPESTPVERTALTLVLGPA